LVIKLPTNDINVGITTLKGISDVGKRERVLFECNKDRDYLFASV